MSLTLSRLVWKLWFWHSHCLELCAAVFLSCSAYCRFAVGAPSLSFSLFKAGDVYHYKTVPLFSQVPDLALQSTSFAVLFCFTWFISIIWNVLTPLIYNNQSDHFFLESISGVNLWEKKVNINITLIDQKLVPMKLTLFATKDFWYVHLALFQI